MKKNLTLLFIALIGLAFNAKAQSYTFNYTGSVQSWVVPTSITSINIDAQGACGAAGSPTVHRGGFGARTRCALTVTPGDILYIYVGGVGTPGATTFAVAGGYNGGGSGSFVFGSWGGGSGGGASDVRMGGLSLADRVVVAGGGGGGAYNYGSSDADRGGDGGGLTGEDGQTGSFTPDRGGTGGTPTAGGLGGMWPGYSRATDGTLLTGGNGAVNTSGGGGGGGLYGGGGGSWSGGGGGSSYTVPSATSVVHTRGFNTAGNGKVIICISDAGTVSGSPTVCAGQTTTITPAIPGGVWASGSPTVATIGTSSGVVTGRAAGVTALTYTVTSGCGVAVRVTYITVLPVPETITGPVSLCAGATVSLSSATAGGVWTSSDVALATIGSTSGEFRGVAFGSPAITYTDPSTGCYTTRIMNVVGITGPSSVCIGSTILLEVDTPDPGMWSSSASTAAVGSSSGVVTGLAMGTTTITYLSSGCTLYKSLTINPLAPIVGNDSVCVGGPGYLTNIVGGGAWSSTNPAVATIRFDSGLVAGIAPGTTTISYLLPTGCITTKTLRTIALPSAITGTMQACPGTTTALANSTASGAWSTLNGLVATVGATSGVVTGVAADTTTILYTVRPGCSVATVVTINPLPAIITGTSIMCPGTQDTLENVTPGGTWSSGTPALVSVDAEGIVKALAGGVGVISYTLPTGCARTKIINLYPIPVPVVTFDWRTGTFYTPDIYVDYQWYDSTQGKILGATSPSLASLYTQYYYVVVTDTNGCKGPSAYYHFNSAILATSTATKNTIRIFPNPATELVFISADQQVTAVITTLDGRKEMELLNATRIDISALPVGIHLMSLYDNNGKLIAVEKLTKQ